MSLFTQQHKYYWTLEWKIQLKIKGKIVSGKQFLSKWDKLIYQVQDDQIPDQFHSPRKKHLPTSYSGYSKKVSWHVSLHQIQSWEKKYRECDSAWRKAATTENFAINFKNN